MMTLKSSSEDDRDVMHRHLAQIKSHAFGVFMRFRDWLLSCIL